MRETRRRRASRARSRPNLLSPSIPREDRADLMRSLLLSDTRLLLTCEHGGNRIPPEYRALFRGATAALASHRGWDPGALALARRLGLKIRYVVFDSWPEVQDALRQHQIDIIPNMGVTAERETFAAFTHPVETFPISIFVRSATNDIQDLACLLGKTNYEIETIIKRLLKESLIMEQ